MKKLKIILISCIFLLESCSLLIKEDKNVNAVTVWDNYCNLIDSRYAGFKTKELDWESYKLSQKDNIKSNPTSEKLFTCIKDSFQFFNDGHFSLFTEDVFYYENYEYETNFSLDLIKSKYLNNEFSYTYSRMLYSELSENIDYIHLEGFTSDVEETSKAFDEVFSSSKPYFIIDLRDNVGGDAVNLLKLLSYFTDSDIKICDLYKKNGSGESYDNYEIFLNRGNIKYNGQVILLVNKQSSSCSDIAFITLKELTNTVIIGESNRAELVGGVKPYELLNGWIVGIPTSNYSFTTEMGGYIDGDIIEVDNEVKNTQDMLDLEIDAQLEEALNWISLDK